MAKVLYITANPKSVEHSYCLSVGQAFLETYQQENPTDEIITLNLFEEEFPKLDHDVFSAWGKLQQGVDFSELTDEETRKVGRLNEIVDQFISMDKYVFVTPLWNLSFPSVVKDYIDAICVAGKTFKYTDQGSVGLLTGKKAIHIQARGGIYVEPPMSELEMGDRFIRSILTFLGVPSIESVIVEGMAQLPDQAEEIKAKAIDEAKKAAIKF
ncbi:FMN-dependent NADH-azoreductase [Ammoniphilus oxalaticus]|uniref:FMN dependent NADH:quinone oxidoreductase n=1 Tax=Ammoniphilus oxalaticus TaxID=66863 RepID=A0A419SLX8_9BACL|nr:FMN-dependent NADH-azoreductase [Ammoniphilus oxalaticus]RKD25068.1 FMN-dependent NADH-azoreductase [Ammoniphilus oxalaticus]